MSFKQRIYVAKGNIVNFANKVDVIVNAAKPSLEGGSGVDGAIHKAAGKGLYDECVALPHAPNRCKTGDVIETSGHNLKCRLFHAVGSKYKYFSSGEVLALRNCYKKSLQMCVDRGYRSIAFPIIGSGSYGWDFGLAAKIAITEIHNFLIKYEEIEKVYIIGFDDEHYFKLKTIIDSYADAIKRGKRLVSMSSCESQKAYFKQVLYYDTYKFSILYVIRLLLTLYPYMYPLTFFVKWFSGKISWECRRTSIEIIVVFKCVVNFLLLSLPCIYRLPPSQQMIVAIFVAYSMLETVLYNSSLLFLKDIQNPSQSSMRSILLIFINIIELQLGFACLYRLCNALSSSLWLDYVYLSLANHTVFSEVKCMFIACVQSFVSIYFVGIILSVFLSGIRSRDYIDD